LIVFKIFTVTINMTQLFNGNCLDELKNLDDDSCDLIFCDLPYGQTSCKWDIIIPWDELWKELMRVKKLRTPIFFTTTTKFGVEIITSAPKKCPFRYDIVWAKSAPVGFLSAKKMPMRKHEMIYVFYEKLPFYDLSSHQHKFVKTKPRHKENLYGMKAHADGKEGKYDPPLPVSIVKEEACYGEAGSVSYKGQHNLENGMALNQGGQKYDPPLPVSVVKEESKMVVPDNDLYGGAPREDNKECGGHKQRYDPPLPTSMLEVKSTRGKHSTEKPVALMEWVLKYYSKEGDVVLDPTMGSGSTGVACKNMGRNFIGIEKDPEIFDMACSRLY